MDGEVAETPYLGPPVPKSMRTQKDWKELLYIWKINGPRKGENDNAFNRKVEEGFKAVGWNASQWSQMKKPPSLREKEKAYQKRIKEYEREMANRRAFREEMEEEEKVAHKTREDLKRKCERARKVTSGKTRKLHKYHVVRKVPTPTPKEVEKVDLGMDSDDELLATLAVPTPPASPPCEFVDLSVDALCYYEPPMVAGENESQRVQDLVAEYLRANLCKTMPLCLPAPDSESDGSASEDNLPDLVDYSDSEESEYNAVITHHRMGTRGNHGNNPPAPPPPAQDNPQQGEGNGQDEQNAEQANGGQAAGGNGGDDQDGNNDHNDVANLLADEEGEENEDDDDEDDIEDMEEGELADLLADDEESDDDYELEADSGSYENDSNMADVLDDEDDLPEAPYDAGYIADPYGYLEGHEDEIYEPPELPVAPLGPGGPGGPGGSGGSGHGGPGGPNGPNGPNGPGGNGGHGGYGGPPGGGPPDDDDNGPYIPMSIDPDGGCPDMEPKVYASIAQKPKAFSGIMNSKNKEVVKTWCRQLEIFLRACSVAPNKRVDMAMTYLVGPALNHMVNERKRLYKKGQLTNSYVQFANILMKAFGVVDHEFEIRTKLQNAVMRNNDVLGYSRYVNGLLVELPEESDEFKITSYLNGVRNSLTYKELITEPATGVRWKSYDSMFSHIMNKYSFYSAHVAQHRADNHQGEGSRGGKFGNGRGMGYNRNGGNGRRNFQGGRGSGFQGGRRGGSNYRGNGRGRSQSSSGQTFGRGTGFQQNAGQQGPPRGRGGRFNNRGNFRGRGQGRGQGRGRGRGQYDMQTTDINKLVKGQPLSAAQRAALGNVCHKCYEPGHISKNCPMFANAH